MCYYQKNNKEYIAMKNKSKKAAKKRAASRPSNNSTTIRVSKSAIVDHAIDIWRLSAVDFEFDDNNKQRFENTISRLNRFLEQHEISINDYEGRTLIDGMNIDIIASEQSPEIEKPTIIKTHTPEVQIKGIVCKRAQVIVQLPVE